MRLLHSPTSPFVRKVVVLAHEAGLIEKITLIPTNPWDENTTITKLNPLAKIPVLLLDDDTPIFDSKLIARYLLDKASNKEMLLPESAQILHMQLEAVADGMAEATVNRFLELNRRPPEKQMEYWLQRYQTSITRSLAWFEERHKSFSSNFTFGALAVAVALSYVDLRYPELNWHDSCPGLSAWHRGVTKRASMQATAPKAG